MSPVPGVIDANIIIGLAKGGVFHLLANFYSPLYVPTAVRNEILLNPAPPGASELNQALGNWITEVSPVLHWVQQFPASLSSADRGVLAAAQAEQVVHVLCGDEQALRVAARYGIAGLRATDLVVVFKRAGLISSAASVLDRMRRQGFGIQERTYRQALAAAGE